MELKKEDTKKQKNLRKRSRMRIETIIYVFSLINFNLEKFRFFELRQILLLSINFSSLLSFSFPRFLPISLSLSIFSPDKVRDEKGKTRKMKNEESKEISDRKREKEKESFQEESLRRDRVANGLSKLIYRKKREEGGSEKGRKPEVRGKNTINMAKWLAENRISR